MGASSIPLLLAGRFAASFYGCEKLVGATEFELVLKPDVESAKLLLMAVSKTFQQFGIRVGDGSDFASLAKPNYRVKPFSSIGNLEFFVAGDAAEFDQLLQSGTASHLSDGTAVTLVSLQGLLMLKERQVAVAKHILEYKVRDLERLRALTPV